MRKHAQNRMVTLSSKEKMQNSNECFFCKEPLTSDDYKEDKVEVTASYIAHKKCVDKALAEYWLH